MSSVNALPTLLKIPPLQHWDTTGTWVNVILITMDNHNTDDTDDNEKFAHDDMKDVTKEGIEH